MTIEQIKELLKLKTENPELEIVWMVDYEVCADDSFSYWRAEIERIEKSQYAERNERVYTDMEELEDDIMNDFWNINKTDEENEIIIKQELSKIDQKDAIIIWLGL